MTKDDQPSSLRLDAFGRTPPRLFFDSHGRTREFDDVEDQVLDVLASELSIHYFPRTVDVNRLCAHVPAEQKLEYKTDFFKALLAQNDSRTVEALAKIIKFYMVLSESPDAVDELLGKLDSVLHLLVMGGMRQDDIEDFRNKVAQVKDGIEKRQKEKSIRRQDPWFTRPKSTLIYEIVTALKETYPGLNNAQAIRVVAHLFTALDIETGVRMRKPKRKVSERDPVFVRLERSYYRFIREFGTPSTLYSTLIK